MRNPKTCFALAMFALGTSAAIAQKDMGAMPMDKGMQKMPMGPAAATGSHKASATVRKADPKAGAVTLEHGPVASLNWPSMTMRFKVQDPALMPKLGEGKKVDVEFVKQGDDYVITSVK